MRGKIFITIAAGIVVVVLVALGWWWFLYHAPSTAPQSTGSFGTAQNKSSSGASGSTAQTNIGYPTIPVGQHVRTIAPGTYTFTAADGSSLGSYAVSFSDQYPNGYTITAVGKAAAFVPGTYTIGSLGTYTISDSGSSGTSTSVFSVDSTSVSFSTSTSDTGNVNTSGVDWLSGGSSTTSTDAGTVFNPTAINQVDASNPTGSGILPNISGSTSSSGSGASGALASLAAAGLIGAATCGAAQLFQTGATAAGAGAGAGAGAAAGGVGVAAGAAKTAISVQTVDFGNYVAQGAVASALGGLLGSIKGGDIAKFSVDDFWSCLTRSIAKIVLNQMTNSIVNWINNGFNGSAAFVTNPTQFFGAIADQAAGQYIQSSALSFLCSPFQLQIRIAIAQSYARRNAQQCTLSKIIGNVNGFMSGNFSAGGWPGLLAYTTIPTNNPYGAYAYAAIGLNASVQTALTNQQNELSLGNGFLDFKKKQNCNTYSESSKPDASASKSVEALPNSGSDTGQTQYEVCDLVHTTPGHVIADALGATNSSTFTELDVAKSFDEIISALITQLVTRTLQSGLSNLSGANGYSSNFYTQDQLQTQSDSQALALQMQGDTLIAQNYGGVEQGSISDIQNAQSQLNDLYNCWSSVAAASSTDQATATTNAQTASSTIAQLQTQVDAYNNEITRANSAITLLEELESSALSAASTDDVNATTNQYHSAQSQGQLISQTDLTTAQQNRTTLQSQMDALNQQTALGLQQCHATQ